MFSRIVSSLAIFAALSAPALATQVSIPYTFTANTPARAAQVNSNFGALAGVINGNIDASNVSTLGFYAANLIPTTTLQAVFGGSVKYTFSNGLTVNGGLTLGTPLAASSGGTGLIASGANGNILTSNGTTWVSSAPVVIAGYVDLTTAQTKNNVFTINAPTGSTNVAIFQTNGTNVGLVRASDGAYGVGASYYGANANVAGTVTTGTPITSQYGGTGLTTSGAPGNSLVSNGVGGWQAVPSAIAPTYGTNGSSYPASHFVAGTCTLNVSSCAVVLSGAAAYTTGYSYACWADPAAIGDSGGLVPSVGNKTGTGFTVFIQGGGSLTGNTAAFGCYGN